MRELRIFSSDSDVAASSLPSSLAIARQSLAPSFPRGFGIPFSHVHSSEIR
jgi:hypothetical protein